MAPPHAQRARVPQLRVGDTVSVAVRHFGEAYARSRFGQAWQSDQNRDCGKVTAKAAERWQ
eukprot:6198891-Pleurochrysis_carterae.AAC.1